MAFEYLQNNFMCWQLFLVSLINMHRREIVERESILALFKSKLSQGIIPRYLYVRENSLGITKRIGMSAWTVICAFVIHLMKQSFFCTVRMCDTYGTVLLIIISSYLLFVNFIFKRYLVCLCYRNCFNVPLI